MTQRAVCWWAPASFSGCAGHGGAGALDVLYSGRPMDQVIFKYPGQKFVGIATRKADGTLNHQGFILIDAVPKEGATLFERPVVVVLTEEELLKEQSRCALNEIVAVAVLGRKT